MASQAEREAEHGASRAGAIAAILFAVLFVPGTMMALVPDLSEGAARVTDFYGTSSNLTSVMTSLYLLAVAGIAFLVFLGSLYRRLSWGHETGILPTVALLTGVAFVATLFVFAAIQAAPSVSVKFGDTPPWNPDVAGVFPQLGFTLLLIPGALCAAAFLVATSLAALRSAALPRWLAYFGFAAAVILLAAVVFMPLQILPLWTLAAGVALLRDAPRPERARGASSVPISQH